MKRNCLTSTFSLLLLLVFVVTPRVHAQTSKQNEAAEGSKPAKATTAKKEAATSGQETEASATSKKSTKPRKAKESETAAAKTKVEPVEERAVTQRRRLPRYFAQLLLDEVQRTAIYSIQEKYQAELDELQKQIDARTMARDEEISGVLKPGQRKHLDELLVQAKNRIPSSRNNKVRVASTGASTSDGENTEEPTEAENPEK